MSFIVEVPLTYAFADAEEKLIRAADDLDDLCDMAPGKDRTIAARKIVLEIFHAVMSQIHEEKEQYSFWSRIKLNMRRYW